MAWLYPADDRVFLHQLFGLFRDDVHQCHRGVVVQLVDQAGNLFGLAVAGVHQKQVGIMLLRRFQAGEETSTWACSPRKWRKNKPSSSLPVNSVTVGDVLPRVRSASMFGT